MSSPFPGMNPYFEQPAHWHDFHTKFVTVLRRQLVPTILPNYIVQLQEHEFIPSDIQLPAQEVEHIPFLEVRDRQGRELVTVIELLSPSNKRPGNDREMYLAKRRALLHSSAHLVEIDLLRGWTPMPANARPDGDYSVLVSRAERRPTADFWPVRLREPLPEIPIPLRAPGEACRVDLQLVLHQVYDGTGYEHFIYAGSPEPPLSEEDSAWAQPLVPISG